MNSLRILVLAFLMPRMALAVLGVGDIVSDPIAEQALLQKNIFDQMKYSWEQTQWAQQLTNLANTLTTVQQQLQTANQVKQAIGDPMAAANLIDSGLFSSYLQNSGIPDTLSQLVNITQQGVQMSATIQSLFQPIDITQWTNPEVSFDGAASFRNPNDPLLRFRAFENAYTRLETFLSSAKSQRKILNTQISGLNTQLTNAQTDAEVQKLTGALLSAQSALSDLDTLEEAAHRQVELLHTLNKNRKEEEDVAAEVISRQRNRAFAEQQAQAIEQEANLASADDAIDFTKPIEDVPSFPGN